MIIVALYMGPTSKRLNRPLEKYELLCGSIAIGFYGIKLLMIHTPSSVEIDVKSALYSLHYANMFTFAAARHLAIYNCEFTL